MLGDGHLSLDIIISAPRSSQFSSSFALGKLFASRIGTDNVLGQISEHIYFRAKIVYLLFIV